MWVNFFICFALALVMLYLPGTLFGSIVRMPSVLRFAFAPLVSVVLYEVFAISYQKMSIHAGFSPIFVPVGVLSAFVCLIALLRRRKVAIGGHVAIRYSWTLLAAYVAVGFVVGMLFFVKALDGTDTFMQAWDNAFHLNVVRYFVDSGNYSALCVTNYIDVSPTPGSSYYPAAWHLICAAIVDLTGSTIPTTISAVNFAFAGVVFPAGMYCFIERVLGSNRVAVFSGAFVSSAFVSFPWSFLTFGPLFPNLASMSMLPAALVVMMGIFANESNGKQRLLAFIGSMIAVLAFGFAQPNSVFTAIVILAPFAFVEFRQIAKNKGFRIADLRNGAYYACCVGVFILLWTTFYILPPLHAPYTVHWASFAPYIQSIMNVLTLAYVRPQASLLLALLVVVGVVGSIKNKSSRWFCASYLITCVMLVIGESSDGFLKTYLTGLWYTDQYRIAAMVGIAATPLACAGAARIVELLRAAYPRILKTFSWKDRRCQFNLVASAALIVCLFVPSFSIPGIAHFDTAFGGFRDDVETMYGASAPNILDASERAFVQEVTEVVDENPGLIINQAFDGSVFTYGLYDLDVFYRSFGDAWNSNETEDSKNLRLHLDEISWNEEVKESACSVGAKYLMMLDYGKGETGEGCLRYYVKNDWVGLNAVTDNTPGFEVVLAKDDMRLYRLIY